MDILNLRNSIIPIFLFLFFQCGSDKDENYVLLKELPPITIIGADEVDIKKSTLYLKRNNETIGTGSLNFYSKSGNKIDVQIGLNKKDSLYNKDEILFYLKGKQYVIRDFQKKKVKSSGVPYIVSYKINGTLFLDREGYIEIKK